MSDPPMKQLHRQRERSWLARADASIQQWLAQEKSTYSYSWPIALNALGGEWMHKVWRDEADLSALTQMLDQQIDSSGQWLIPTNRVDFAMKGYSLLYAVEQTKSDRYSRAAEGIASMLLDQHPRAADGSLPYEATTHSILVDTLAMICPFLARYANQYHHEEARELSVQQLLNFIAYNVDKETALPFHGYYADGPKRLGLHGWGRGVGWYLVGLVDTIAELPETHTANSALRHAFQSAACALQTFQRADGHWSWAVLQPHDTYDSSTTALVGYSLARGLQLKLLGNDFDAAIKAALKALVHVTRVNGLLDGSLGECRGLGKYPQTYTPQPWLQGSATAFAACYFAYYGEFHS
jgi:rhamnogalacturonyl hydrolase YesR